MRFRRLAVPSLLCSVMAASLVAAPPGHDISELAAARAGADEIPSAAVTDSHGYVYLAGMASTGHRSRQIYVAKLDPSGQTRLYTAHLGGSGMQQVTGLAVDDMGSAYVTGFTSSADFPVHGGFQTSSHGGLDAFVAKLDAKGTGWIYSSYLGGSGDDIANGIAVDRQGVAYVTGRTTSPDFAQPGAFVAAIAADGGALRYAASLGMGAAASANAIATDTAGGLFVAGGNNGQAFLLKMAADGTKTEYTRAIGGAGPQETTSVAVDAQGAIYLGGWIGDAGSRAVWAAKYSPDGARVYSMQVGTADGEAPPAIAADSVGNAYISFVNAGAGRLVKLSADGERQLAAQAVEALASSRAVGLALAGGGRAVLAGGGATGGSYAARVATCEFHLSDTAPVVGAAGGAGTLRIDTTPECEWQAEGGAVWLEAASAGTGSGTIAYRTSANDGPARKAAFVVAGETVVMTQAAGGGSHPAAGILRDNAGFHTQFLAPCDDCSSAQASELGFAIDLYGRKFGQAWVNANGSISFDGPETAYVAPPLESLTRAVIAPFWSDVDTRGGAASITYGQDIVDGHRAFGVNWTNVGYYSGHQDKLNTFQLVLIEREDVGAGAFDIEMNYGSLEWAAGDVSGRTSARAGYTNGTGGNGTWMELPAGATLPAGRHTFSVRPSDVTVTVGAPGGGAPAPVPMAGPVGTIVEYPTTGTSPLGIVAGPDGALWFTEEGGNNVARMTTSGSLNEYTVPTASSQPFGIARGPDGLLWFTESNVGKIAKVTTGASFNEFPLSGSASDPTGITVGPDGALWFAEFTGNNIGRITTNGTITEYPVLTASAEPEFIAVGPDGNLWFTEFGSSKVGRITTSGVITEFPTLTASSGPRGIVAGPDGALWFAEQNGNKIGRITTGGSVSEYPIPTSSSNVFGITLGPDGAMWFAESGGNNIGRITTGGVINEYPIPTQGSTAGDLTTGPDGQVWFSEYGTAKIGAVFTGAGAATSAISSLSPANVLAGAGPFTLQVNGSGFQSGAAVYWAGAMLATTYISAAQLNASVPGAFIALAGTGMITVANPNQAPCAPVNLAISSAAGLGISKSHSGSFTQGQQGATYTVTVSNAVGSLQTTNTVMVTENVPSGLSLVSMSGTGWTCPGGNTCTRSDSLAAGASYPTITVKVNVAANATSPQVNSVTVSGGGSPSASYNDNTTIVAPPSLTITKSHSGSFSQGQTGATFTVTVSNGATAGPTSNTVTVTDNLPLGLVLSGMAGTGWSCGGNVCTRSDALAGNTSYPPIIVTVNVMSNASGSLTNVATVVGGGSATPPPAQDTVSIVAPVNCSALFFDATIGGASLTQSCSVANPTGLTAAAFTTSGGSTWLNAGITAGLLNVTVNPANVVNPQSGVNYSGTVAILNGSTTVATINVSLTLTAVVTISPTSSSVGNGGVSGATFNVTSNGPWSVLSSNQSLITITSPSAANNFCSSGNGSVMYNMPANTSPNVINGSITVLSGCSTNGPTFAVATFSITQAAQTQCNSAQGTVFPSNQQTSFTYSAAGTGSNATIVRLNNVCNAPSNPPTWVTIVPGSFNGQSFAFNVGLNNGTARSGQIQVDGDFLNISQNALQCTYSVNTTPGFSSSFPSTGGPGSVTVNASAGCTWTATPSSSTFIRNLSPTSPVVGSGPTSTIVTFNLPANTGSTTQTGSIAIAGLGQTLQYTITEAPPAVNGISATYTCSVAADPLPVRTLRAEGVSELTNDLKLACSGVSVGGVQGDVIVTYNTAVTNHTLSNDSTNTMTDVLLLNVDPGVQSWTLGTNAYRGVVAGPNAIRFPSVLLAPETNGFSHSFRVTNARVNAAQLATQLYNSATQPAIMATVSIQPPQASPSSGAPFQFSTSATQTVGQIPATLTSGKYTASPSANFAVGALTTGGTGGTSFWPLTFTEKQTNSFLPATATGQTPSSTPGTLYVSESGFINTTAFGNETGFSNNGNWTTPGSAMGTRLLVNIANVPCGVTLYAQNAPASGGAQLYSADSNGVGGFAVVSSAVIPPISGTSFPGYETIPLTPAGNTGSCTTTQSATVTWEVTSALANSPGALLFNIYAYPPSANLSGVTFNGIGAGANASAGLGPSLTASAPGPTNPVPRFSGFQRISGGNVPTAALSFLFQPATTSGGGAAHSALALATLKPAVASRWFDEATLAGATAVPGLPAPQTSGGGQCSQTVSVTVTNNASTAANNVDVTIEGSQPFQNCLGPAGSSCKCSGNTCTGQIPTVPPQGAPQIMANSSSCTPQSYTGYVTSDDGNNDPTGSAGQAGLPTNALITPVQSPSPFAQGDSSDSLIVQVQNTGGDAPAGTVTVSGTLPANSGLTIGPGPVQPKNDIYSPYWACTNTSTTWSCTYGNNPALTPPQFPFLASDELQSAFTQFTVPFQNTTACSSVNYSQQVTVVTNGNQYIAGTTQTITVKSKIQITAPTNTTLPPATAGTLYTFSGFSATGGCGTPTWSNTSPLPAGLTMSAAGVISGTPTVGGTTSFTVQVADSTNPGTTASNTYSISVSAPSVTVKTTPTGLQFSVDGAPAQVAPQTLNLSPGSHILSVVTTQSGATGVRNVFQQWDDGTLTNSRTINVGGTAQTFNAVFQTQYQLTISASPAADGTVSPATGNYYPQGPVTITATANTGYAFNNWSGAVNTTNSTASVTMSGPQTVTANFSALTTIVTNPPGLQFSIDGGASLTAPQSLNLTPGSHTLTTSSQGSAGTQNTFLSWSDGGGASHSITVGASPMTYTATFQTQYQLNLSVSPAGSGTVSPASGAYYSSNSSVTITATQSGNNVFSGWTGGTVANASSPTTTVTMSGPMNLVANFATAGITIQTSPPGMLFTVDGGTAQTAPKTLALSTGSHNIAVASPQAGPAGTPSGADYVFVSWSDGLAASHNINVTGASAVYTATFQEQFQLTILTSPPGAGTVSPPSGGYYAANSSVQISATAASGYQFAGWSGNVANPFAATTTALMSTVETVTANFSQVIITGPTPLAFYPVTPCRVVDTRSGGGAFGAPLMSAGSTRAFPIPTSTCGIPSTAQAYALNVTVLPQATLGYLTIWPTGQSQPGVSTLNSPNGAVVANAAIVPAGTNGSVSAYVTDATQVIIDINGYFAPQAPGGLAFYPLIPCRVADTRGATGNFGGPPISAGQTRNFQVPVSGCGAPSTAQAYSLNMTVVPSGPLGYLTTWPTGVTQPVVSTLNALDGRIVANAAIVPAGTAGEISVFASNATNVIIDINGYFAPPGGVGALYFYQATPCRVVDTRGASGLLGGPIMSGGSTRSFNIPSSTCNIPNTAQGYSLNVTVVPPAPMQYLTIWPTGNSQPLVSTLNAFNGAVVANAAIVPAGSGGAISVFVSDTTQVILDINGYFAP